MARINFVVRSDVYGPEVDGDVTADLEGDRLELVFRFREELGAYLTRFGHVGRSGDTRDTVFSSVHDLAAYFLTVPTGEIALQLVEIMIGLRFIEEEAQAIWHRLAPRSAARVQVENIRIDGMTLEEFRGQHTASPDRSNNGPARRDARNSWLPILALLLLVGGAYLGIWRLSDARLPPERSPPSEFVCAPEIQIEPAAAQLQTVDRVAPAARPQARSTVFSDRGVFDREDN